MRNILAVAIIFVLSCCSMVRDNARYRLYKIYDMEDSLQDYYTNNLKRISPGLACGDFKNQNAIGCFKLQVDASHGKAIKLVYQDLSNDNVVDIYYFDPPENNVFIEKIYEAKLRTSNALPNNYEVDLETGQPSLKLIFFGKSAVVFYWKEGSFRNIWTAD